MFLFLSSSEKNLRKFYTASKNYRGKKVFFYNFVKLTNYTANI